MPNRNVDDYDDDGKTRASRIYQRFDPIDEQERFARHVAWSAGLEDMEQFRKAVRFAYSEAIRGEEKREDRRSFWRSTRAWLIAALWGVAVTLVGQFWSGIGEWVRHNIGK